MSRPLSNHYTKLRATRRVAKLHRWQKRARDGDPRAIEALDKRGVDPFNDSVYVDDSPRGRVRYQVVVEPIEAGG